ncbi:nitrile hydratase accessory protein [Dongia sp.]|uniref:nitrile hydratase accessory protein n=1 Tax=Dongia sp. TaxID=1977262 RepID=UPI0035AF120B
MAAATPGPLLGRDGEPLFAEPWQAQIVAMATAMIEKGRFTAARWSESLGAEIRRALADGAPDTTATYYRCVLATFEALVKEAELTSAAELHARKLQWIEAYENTPHGQPVTLNAARLPADANGGLGGG